MHQDNRQKAKETSPHLSRDSHTLEHLIKKGRKLHDQEVSTYLADCLACLISGAKKAAGFSVKTSGQSLHS